jgi:hypothetical protein
MKRVVAGTLATAVAATFLVTTVPQINSARAAALPYRAFSSGSYWNSLLPADAPLHPDSDRIIDFLVADNVTNYVLLSGTDDTGKWGQPVYWVQTGDPVYDVRSTRYMLPPEFASLRIPRGARPDPTSDAEMTVYDPDRGYVAGLWLAAYDPATDSWTAGGGDIYYLGSNGLHGTLSQSDEARNSGNHRGLPPPTYAVRYDEITAGRIDHVLKIAVNTVKGDTHVFPMVGDEPGSDHPYAPVEGARIRIKPSVDLGKLNLSPPALTVARALQRYGAIIGDQTGAPVELKMENTIAEGRGHLWNGVLNSASLAAIPLRLYEVIEHGYEPPLGEERLDAESAVKITAPRRSPVWMRKGIRIAWTTSGAPDGWVRLRYRVRGWRSGAVASRTEDDGRFLWRPPRGLRGRVARIVVALVDHDGRHARDRSRWFSTL